MIFLMRKLTKEQWIDLIREYDESSYKINEFCELHHVGVSTFHKKRRELVKNKNNLKTEPIVFHEVNLDVKPVTSSQIKFKINEISLSLDINMNDSQIKRIIRLVSEL